MIDYVLEMVINDSLFVSLCILFFKGWYSIKTFERLGYGIVVIMWRYHCEAPFGATVSLWLKCYS